MGYSRYTEREFIVDESFQNWVRKTNEADIAFWESWIVKHPEKKQTIENARQLLLQLYVTEKPLPAQDIAKAWQQLKQTLQQRSHTSTIRDNNPTKKHARWPRWYAAAAMVSAIVIASLIYQFLWKNDKFAYRTSFGQTAVVSLPDGSQVVLNANTLLEYNKKWSTRKSREVWLEGEAYFSVTKQKNRACARFVVHTPDLDVVVLGTQFNVSNRKNKTRVVLNEGKVKVNTNAEEKSASLVMKPGELIEFSRQKEALVKKTVDPEMYSSWKNNKLIFDNTSMQEIAEMIESTYGLQVKFQDRKIASRTLTGVLPTDNIDILLLALSKSFNVAIRKNSNQIIISKN
jgi:ferric-dicitrate binding protein FerR (iron transport regulator)